jgi:hypothetical protein
MPHDTCLYCRFFESGTPAGSEGDGECRRGSPRVKFGRRGPDLCVVGSAWPVVDANDWCGEHRRPEA